jgi:hypothetical protein
MKKRILFALLSSLLFLTISCRKDIIDFIPDPGPGVSHPANILGVVTDESNQPVEGATVTYKTLTRITDANGVYTFRGVDVDSKHSYLTIHKDGYFDGSRVFTTNTTTTLNLRNILLKKEFNHSFDGNNGGDVSIDNVTLRFPAGSIKMESTGAGYTGEVKVAVKHLNPSNRDVFQQMPGNLTGINTSGEVIAMATFGMVAVELQSPGGEKLNIQTGSQAEITMTLPSSLVSKAPASIPLWYFDEEKGYWKEEGSAVLENGKYIGKVSHFSFWNCDAQFPLVQMTGKVVDENGNPLSGATISLEVVSSGATSAGWTDINGIFTGGVPLGEAMILNLYISAQCQSQVLYTAEIGPFSQDVTLPDITITFPTQYLATVAANYVNCDGDPVQDGYVSLNYEGYHYLFPIENGVSNVAVYSCSDSGTGSVVAVDIATIKESDPVTVSIPGVNILGTINVCAYDADHITVQNTELGFDMTVIDSLKLIRDAELKVLNCSNLTNNDGDDVSIFMVYNDGSFTDFIEGTFPVTSANILIRDNFTGVYYYNPGNPTGTITITQGGTNGDKIFGTYSITLVQEGTSAEYTFTGSFQLTGE